MTHPLTNALAMRAAAAEATRVPKFCIEAEKDRVEALHAYRAAILALPLEADRDALLREALTLPEVEVLYASACELAGYMSLCGDDGDLLRNLVNALQPFLALETP